MRLAQIVPDVTGGGVADFAVVLGETLHARHGVESRIVTLPQRSGRAALDALAGERTVLVHYANYGYAARGCPRWLVSALERWRQAQPERRLGVIFHELWGGGSLRTSSFWLKGLQRRLAFALARRADAAGTSLALYARMLAPARADVGVLAMASTIGESSTPVSFEERVPRLIVFGGSGARERAFGALAPALERACNAFEAGEIWNVGAPLAAPPSRFAGRHVYSTGALAAEEVRALLARSRYAFLAYPPAFLGKSSVFAAYSAHGLATAVAWDVDQGRGELETDVHFLDTSPSQVPRCARDDKERATARDESGEHTPTCHPERNEGPGRGKWAEMAAAAHAWYRGHDLATHADTLAGWLCR